MNGDLRIGQWLVEPSLNTVSCNGTSRHLEPKVMAVLVCLAKAENAVVSKQQLMEEVWKDTFVTDDVLTRSISELRDAFEDEARNPKVIQTIAKQGYRLLLPVSVAEHPTPGRRRLGLLLCVGITVALIAIGSLVAFHRYRGSAAVVRSSPLTITRLTHSGRVEPDGAAVSPDGNYFYYVNMENGHDSIRMRQVGGINEITIFQGKGGSVYGLAVSPKGDKLYFAQDNDLFVMPLPGGMARKIVSNAASPAAVSPDGTRVAFLRRVLNTWNVVLADADGSNEQVVRRRPMPLFYSDESLMSWSPDGRGLAVGARSSSSGELAIIDLARKTERVIPPQGWQGGIGNTAWLPDSSGIVLQAWTEGSFQLWLVKLPEGTARRLTHYAANYTNASVTADGQTILSTQIEMSTSIWVADYNNPMSAREVSDSPKALQGGHGITWTADGKIVYGSEEAGRDLWLFDLQSGSKQRLTEDPVLDALPRASRDRRYIFFTKWRPDGWDIWRMDADGRNSVRLTNSGHAGFPQVSHDGRTVLFISSEAKSHLWRISTETGKAEMVTDTDARRPAFFSPDDRFIGFFSKEQKPEETIIIDARSGARVTTIEGRNQSFTPDQKALLFIGDYQGVDNIMVRPLDGRAAYPLTRFREKGVDDFAISLDGKKLAIVRGNAETDVVAITGFHNPGTQ